MMVLIIGGSGSGKSAYAEELACLLAKQAHTTKYYLAAMQIFDEEGMRKAKRHRALRKGKNFLTIEQPRRIEEAICNMESGEKTVLLECISNLTANEMFPELQKRTKEETVEIVLKGVAQLRQNTTHLIVVSNNVFEDGILYDPSTMDYIYAMGAINTQLAAWADQVFELVAGIPVPVTD